MLVGPSIQIWNKQSKLNITGENSQPAGGRPVGYLQSVVELSSGIPKTNPASGREEDLNPGPPDYKSSALTTRPRYLFIYLFILLLQTITFKTVFHPKK